MKIAVMQPYLFPYVGYYQLVAAVDRFVFFDDVNFIVRGWINRNRILVGGEPRYFTVPLRGVSQNALINSVAVMADDPKWSRQILDTLRQTYAKAPFRAAVMPIVEEVLLGTGPSISVMAESSVRRVCEYVGISPSWATSSMRDYGNRHLKAQERVIDICRREGASAYINPANGRALYSVSDFARAGLDLGFLRPTLSSYPQRATEFVPGLSILDLLMNVPPEEARRHLAAGVVEPAGADAQEAEEAIPHD